MQVRFTGSRVSASNLGEEFKDPARSTQTCSATCVAQDANDELYLATSPAVAAVTGEYFIGSHPRIMPPLASDPVARRRLWEFMEHQTGTEFRV